MRRPNDATRRLAFVPVPPSYSAKPLGLRVLHVSECGRGPAPPPPTFPPNISSRSANLSVPRPRALAALPCRRLPDAGAHPPQPAGATPHAGAILLRRWKQAAASSRPVFPLLFLPPPPRGQPPARAAPPASRAPPRARQRCAAGRTRRFRCNSARLAEKARIRVHVRSRYIPFCAVQL